MSIGGKARTYLAAAAAALVGLAGGGASAVITTASAGATSPVTTTTSPSTTSTTATSTSTSTSDSSSATPASVPLVGHGWGHGRGMGQWGALGYALDGETYSWILAHYYGGTTMGTAADADIRVRLVENDGNDLIVTSASPFVAAGLTIPGGQAVRFHLTTTPDTWQVDTAPSCGGPWTAAGQAVDDGSNPTAVIAPASAGPTAPASSLLQLCLAGRNLTVRGSIDAAEVSGVPRTVNVLPLDSYVEGVVTSESPSYWGNLGSAGPQGEPEGFQALEAQAVAARTYARADQQSNAGAGEYGYADICDTTACQVYGGEAAETTLGDLAVTDTAGQVLVNPTGAAVLAEFSSSTGGWTAGGAFPAVADAGDSVCVPSACNPNHDWTASLPNSTVQSAYPSIGALQSVVVTGRTGPAQADFGGRATAVTITGTAGSVTVTGDTFADEFGLKSDFFSVGTTDPGASPATTTSTSTTTSSTTSTTTTSTTSTTTTTTEPAVPADRLAGIDREDTAVAVSEASYPAAHSAKAVVLTRDDDYADALAGAPLAAREGGPLLMTTPSGVDAPVLAEIQRVAQPGAIVYVLGGTAALSPTVDSTLIQAGYKVVRIEGDTRYATAVAIAKQLGDPHTVFEVTGQDFPDGLSAAPAAIAEGAAILLTDGSTQATETAAYLDAHPSDVRFAIGGPAALADPGATAVQGTDRYATSVAVAQRFFSHPSVVGIATGIDFPDAMAAGPALGTSSPLLLVPSTAPLPASVSSYLASLGPALKSFEIFGGTTAVSQDTVAALAHSAP